MAYDDNPRTARVPLTGEEVEALLLTDGRDLAGRPGAVRHLLSRMRAAFAAHMDTTRALQRDIELIREETRRHADPVRAALSALAACSTAEQRAVYDLRTQALLDAVDEANAACDLARVAAASETNRARLVLGQVLSLPDLTQEARAQIAAALSQIPVMTRPGGVQTPSVTGGFVVPPADATSPP